MDRNTAEGTMELIKKIFASHEAEFRALGVAVAVTNACTFSPHDLTTKIQAVDISGDVSAGTPVNAFAEQFKRLCVVYGMKESDLGTTVSMGGRKYTLVGLNPKRRAKPLIIKRDDGKEFISTVEGFKAYQR